MKKMRKKIILSHNKTRFIKINKKIIIKKTRPIKKIKNKVRNLKNFSSRQIKSIIKKRILLKKKVLRKRIKKENSSPKKILKRKLSNKKNLREFFPILRKKLLYFSKSLKRKSFYRVLKSNFFLRKRESVFFYTYLKSKFKFGSFSRNASLRNLTRSLNKNINYTEKFLENSSPRLTKTENNFFTIQKLGHLRFRSNFREILADRIDLQYTSPNLFFRNKKYSDFTLDFKNFDFYTKRYRRRELQKIFMLGNSFLKIPGVKLKRRAFSFYPNNFSRFNMFFLLYTYRFGIKKTFKQFKFLGKYRRLKNRKRVFSPIFCLRNRILYKLFLSKFFNLRVLRKCSKFKNRLVVKAFFLPKIKKRKKKALIRKTYKLLNKFKSVSINRLIRTIPKFFVANSVFFKSVKIFDSSSKIIKHSFLEQLGFIGKFFLIKKNFPINNFYIFYPNSHSPAFSKSAQFQIYTKSLLNLTQKINNLDREIVSAASLGLKSIPTLTSISKPHFNGSNFKNPDLKHNLINYNFDRVHLKHFNKRFFNYSLRTVFRPILLHTTWRLERDLKTIYGSNYQFFIRYSFLNPKKFSPVLFSRFITRRLTQRFTLFETMKVLKKFLRQAQTRGYLFKASGRFTKKQRASSYIYRHGQVTISTFSREIKYNIENVRLKYGSCSIKLWIDYGGKKN